MLEKHVNKIHGRSFFVVRSLLEWLFPKLAGGVAKTPANPPAQPLSAMLAKVINFTIIDLNIAQEEEKLGKPV